MTQTFKKAGIASVIAGALFSTFSFNVQAAPNHDKNVIGYLTQWEASKGEAAGYSVEGEATHLNVNLDLYSVINFAFIGVAKDGSLHSGDFRNTKLYMDGAVQEPAALLNNDTALSWDLPILWGELEYLHYFPENDVSDAANVAKVREQGFVKHGNGWLHQPSGMTGNFPIPLKKEGGALGLIDLAHKKGVKVMAAIGGWNMSKHFPEVAADPVKKARFLADIDKLMALGFDGIDINWEFPGFGGVNFNGSNDDFDNFELLMEDIRTRIGRDKKLSAAFSASTKKLEGFDWNRLSKSMDYFNMMTYNLDGGWSEFAGHNAPLFPYAEQQSEALNLDTLREWLTKRGVPQHKINLGLAYYGRGVQTREPYAYLGAPTAKRKIDFPIDGPKVTATDIVNWPAHSGQPNYNAIIKAQGWEHKWDVNAQVPYAVKDQYFISFDNPQSIKHKAEYVLNNDLGGVVAWQVNGDVQCDSFFIERGDRLKECISFRSPLAEAVDSVFSNGSKNTPPELTVPALEPIQSGTWTQFTVSAVDAENNPITFSAVNAGITDNGNGTATVSYTAPQTDTEITTSISIIASDGIDVTTKSINMIIKPVTEMLQKQWQHDVTYEYGDKVAFKGVVYQAQWRNWGEQPGLTGVWAAQNFEIGDPSDDHWVSNVSYSKAQKIIHKGVVYKAQWNNWGEEPGVANVWIKWVPESEEASQQVWQQGAVYEKGDKVLYRDKIYQAQWRNWGEAPGTSAVWTLIGSALDYNFPEWQASQTYVGGDSVIYNAVPYKAKWWTRGDNPEKKESPWERLN